MAPMTTRCTYDENTMVKKRLHDGRAKRKMKTRIRHEGEHSCSLPAFFWHAKDFVITHEVAAEAQEH